MDGWRRVPDVLLLHVYSYLPFRDKLSASSTCKHWRELLFHPVNWSHINLNYATDRISSSSYNNNAAVVDRRRENFLKCRTGHFISGCSVVLSTEPQLLVDNILDIPQYFPSRLDADIASLFQYLCLNKNLNALSIVQAHDSSAANPTFESAQTSFIHQEDNHSRSTSTQFATIPPPHGSNLHREQDDCCTHHLGSYADSIAGVITRSKSQKIREKNLKTHQISERAYLNSQSYNVELDLLLSSSSEYSHGSSINFTHIREGCNLQ